MDQRKKIAIFTVGYLAWQIAFSILVSPLVFGILTFEQMGYTLKTLYMGIIVGVSILALIAVVGKWTSAAIAVFVPGLKQVKTKEQFEEFWKVTLRGCDDGIIA